MSRVVLILLIGLIGSTVGCKKATKPAGESPKAAHQEPAQAGHQEPPQVAHQETPQGSSTGEPARLDEAPTSIFNLNDATILKPIDVHTLTPSQIQFGIAPKRTKDIEYADNVIVMEEEDKAVRAMATNGLSWTFDANAPHVNEFQEGKIVFATGLAVGKIVDLKRQGDQVTAVLAPVQLTEVIKNGSFAMNQPLDVNNMIAYAAPDFPQPKDANEEPKSSSLDEEDEGHFVEAVVVSKVSNGKWTPASMVQSFADGRRISYQMRDAKWTDPRVSIANVSPLRLTNGFERIRLTMPLEGDPEVPIPPPASKANFAPAEAAQKIQGAPTELDLSDARTKAVASNSGIGVQFYYDKKGIKLFTECLLETIGANIEFKMVIKNAKFETAGVKIGGHLGVKLMAEAARVNDFETGAHEI